MTGDKITAADIPDELVQSWLADGVGGSWKEFIARRLNDAIAQGVVSPPVYLVVDNKGHVLIDNQLHIPVCFPSTALATERAAKTWLTLPETQHYKGGLE